MQKGKVSDLRLEMRIRNNILWHAIFDNYDSVAAFCRRFKLSQTDVGALLNLTMNPRREDGRFRKASEDVALAVRILPEDLFPQYLYEAKRTKIVMELDAKRIAAAKASGFFLPRSKDPTAEKVERVSRRRVLLQLMSKLWPREEKILRARFGLDGSEKTLEEVGRSLRITRERVRGIEIRAMEKLRHLAKKEGLTEELTEDL